MRKSTLEKRNKFLQVTEQLFCERGYKNTSVKDICKELETTTGSFYFMFDSKEGILAEIVKKYTSEYLNAHNEMADKKGTLKDVIVELIDYKYEFYKKHVDFIVMYETLYLETGRASLVIEQLEQEVSDSLRNAIAAVLKNHKDEVALDANRLEDIALLIVGILKTSSVNLFDKIERKETVDFQGEREFFEKVVLNLLDLK